MQLWKLVSSSSSYWFRISVAFCVSHSFIYWFLIDSGTMLLTKKFWKKFVVVFFCV